MRGRRTPRAALAALILSALLATAPPAGRAPAARAAEAEAKATARAKKVTVEGGKAVVKKADAFRRTLRGKKGLQRLDEGAVFIPKTLRSRAVVVVAEAPGAGAKPPGALGRLAAALDAHGLIGAAPRAASKVGKTPAAEALGNLGTLLSWLEGTYRHKPGKLFVLGWGRSGELAYQLAAAAPERFAGLVVASAEAPKLDKTSLAAFVKLPVLLVHGEADKATPADRSRDAKKALEAAGVTVELKTLPDVGHEEVLTKHGRVFLDWIKTTAKAEPAEPAPKGPVAAAQRLFMKGEYAGAAKAYEKLLGDKSLRVGAAIGLARAQAMTGKYTDALATLKSVADDAGARADWHAATADLLHTVGRYNEALTAAAKAHELRPAWAPAIFAHGRILETLGRKKDAVAVYKTMSRTLEDDRYRQDARSLVALGRIMDRYAILTGQRASEQAANILHNYLQEAYLKVDAKYWPANVAAAMFLLSKHRPPQAAKEFALAAKLNAKVPAVHAGRAAMELSRWRFEQCLRHVGEALKVNPHHADSLVMKAVCLMQWRKFDQVLPVIEEVLKVNPNHLEALSLAAALHHRTREPKKAGPYVERVRRVNAGFAQLPNTIGQWLAAGRQFDEAEKFYREAMKLAPELAGPVTNLGRLYMQTGQEDQAVAVLKKAHEIDNFRSDVANYLNLLTKMRKYQVRETEHFIVKLDGKQDAVLLAQVAEYMERIHKEVARDFDHEPSEKTLIEIFPTHADFSVRISGRGWIGTVGACTGRVIAVVAPNKERSRFGTHNWATVLRHEYTHTVTLAATENRIPHWFTEACAVWQQPDKRNYRYVQMLVNATRRGKLFPVKEMDWGFIRPKQRGDRSLAYAQAEWTMEYIIETRGYETVVKMLRGFRDGLPQEEVFRKIVGVGEKDFDKGFREWAKKTVKQWGFNPDAPPDYAKAKKAAEANPDDAQAQADYAVAQYYRRNARGAEQAARKALKIDPEHKRALAVLAAALAAQKKHDEAIRHARKLESIDHTTSLAPKVLAQCHIAKRRWAEAIPSLELLQQRQPLDSFSYEQLAKIYTQLGQPDKALPSLLHLHRHTMRDAKYARQIAEIYRTMGQHDQALAYFEEITHINPYQPNAYEAIAAIHRSARRYEQAVAAIENVCLIRPDAADAWAKCAMLRYLDGRAARNADKLLKAKQAAEKALHIDPDSQAKQILERIDLALESVEDKP